MRIRLVQILVSVSVLLMIGMSFINADLYSIANTHGLTIYFSTAQTTSYESEYDAVDLSTYTGWGSFLKNKFN